jgi:hypothetical protein
LHRVRGRIEAARRDLATALDHLRAPRSDAHIDALLDQLSAVLVDLDRPDEAEHRETRWRGHARVERSVPRCGRSSGSASHSTHAGASTKRARPSTTPASRCVSAETSAVSRSHGTRWSPVRQSTHPWSGAYFRKPLGGIGK